MKSQSYSDLEVWKKAIDLCEVVYQCCANFPKSEWYALSDQMRRAAVSVPSNIAEGQARQYPSEFRQFLAVAKGSLAELDTQRIIAARLHFITEEQSANLETRITEIRKMLWALTESLKR
jgi:four helix bundle protein